MATERKAHIVYYEPGAESESLDALNEFMNDGWLPIQTTGMGGAATGAPAGVQAGYAALVILQREREYAVSGFGG